MNWEEISDKPEIREKQIIEATRAIAEQLEQIAEQMSFLNKNLITKTIHTANIGGR